MSTGIVKWLDDKKGVGFIEQEGGSDDLFAHFSENDLNCHPLLKQGATVSYEIVNGMHGQEVRLLAEPVPLNQAATTDQAEADLAVEPLMVDASVFLKALRADLDQERLENEGRMRKQRDAFWSLHMQLSESHQQNNMHNATREVL